VLKIRLRDIVSTVDNDNGAGQKWSHYIRLVLPNTDGDGKNQIILLCSSDSDSSCRTVPCARHGNSPGSGVVMNGYAVLFHKTYVHPCNTIRTHDALQGTTGV
jgi:hypothetical protein